MSNKNGDPCLCGDKETWHPECYRGVPYPKTYTAAQLRQAKVEVLREAADDAEKHIDYPMDEEDIATNGHLEFMAKHLRHMAQDLEDGK